MRKCNNCQLEKPETEFYKRSGTNNCLSECKSCMKQRSKDHPKADSKISTVESERNLIDYLNGLGIPTLPGKSLGHTWADIICWGCVLVESKYSNYRAGKFSWSFSAQQYNNGLRADIIILTCDWGDGVTYHAFDAFSPILYNQDTKLMKTGLFYTPNRSQSGRKNSLSDAILQAAAGTVYPMIEEKRLKVEANLRQGIDWLKNARNRIRQL